MSAFYLFLPTECLHVSHWTFLLQKTSLQNAPNHCLYIKAINTKSMWSMTSDYVPEDLSVQNAPKAGSIREISKRKNCNNKISAQKQESKDWQNRVIQFSPRWNQKFNVTIIVRGLDDLYLDFYETLDIQLFPYEKKTTLRIARLSNSWKLVVTLWNKNLVFSWNCKLLKLHIVFYGH